MKVEITDAHFLGDAFIAYANNALKAISPVPEARSDVNRQTFDLAVSDLRYSSTQFILTAPATIRVFVRSSPFGRGQAFLEAKSVRSCSHIRGRLFLVSTQFLWYNAEAACKAYGGKLAGINSKGSGEHAKSVINQCLPEGRRSAWIGEFNGQKNGSLSVASYPDKSTSKGTALRDFHSRSLPVLCQLPE